jgi:diaminopimelate epimerase
MTIEFFKYQGTGNDFVILDNRLARYGSLSREAVKSLCDRRFGIGADGLMLLNNREGVDFEMKYFNADGGESTMCGNGGRCLVKAASDLGLKAPLYRFHAIDGLHDATIETDGMVCLRMKDVRGISDHGDHFILDTGSPHYVMPVNGVADMDVYEKGHAIRYSSPFAAEGINVNFIEKSAATATIVVRTYERGVEDETLSCGTGVTAAALVSYAADGLNEIEVHTRGGRLQVRYVKDGDFYHDIWLKGPAERVFTGTIDIP